MIKVYFFGGETQDLPDLYENGFDGTLFLYNAAHGDQFLKISRYMDTTKDFNYMVAVRPYAISPHYLCLLDRTFGGRLTKHGKLQINLISGNPRVEEYDFDGYVDDISDYSNKIEKSKYLIKFLEVINNMKVKIPDIYVSITNEFTFDASCKHNNKMIINYTDYLNNTYNIKGRNIMLSVGPIIREEGEDFPSFEGLEIPKDNIFVTSQELGEFLNKLEGEGIYEVIFYRFVNGEEKRIYKFVKEYKDGKYRKG